MFGPFIQKSKIRVESSHLTCIANLIIETFFLKGEAPTLRGLSFHSEVLGLVSDSVRTILRTRPSATKPRTSDWKPNDITYSVDRKRETKGCQCTG